MNCDEFNDRLHEFLDETLDPGVQAEARNHLRECTECRRACAREDAVATSIRQSLEHAAAGLSLRRETWRNVSKTLESRTIPSRAWFRARRWFASVTFRWAGASAALLCVALWLLGTQAPRRTAREPTAQAGAGASFGNLVINVPIQTETRVFRRQNHMVTDSLSANTSVAHASFSEGTLPARKPSSKPL